MVINHGGERPKAELEDLESIVAFGSAVIPPYYTPILGERAPQAQLTRWTVAPQGTPLSRKTESMSPKRITTSLLTCTRPANSPASR